MMEKKEKNRPLISVVVPVYGTEQYLDRCLKSLLEQSYRNLEIIVVNDASPGDVNALISRYIDDVRIKYIVNEKNQGLLRTRVIGSRHACGKYIAFVDSDDYVSYDFYRTLLEKAEETKADITIGKTVWDDAGERYIYNYHDSCFHYDILEGETLRREYFGQGTYCYSWHTVWNKLYKKELWDECMPEFETVDRHLIMTEDIYFSTILFFKAARAAFVKNDAYFYCVNENASTNSDKVTIGRFEKNLEDIRYVFDKLADYMQKEKAGKEEQIFLSEGRSHYAKMWNNLAVHTFSGDEKEHAVFLTEKLSAENYDGHIQDEYFFESRKTPWNGGLEYIKEEIAGFSGNYLSFDIFDTLVKRPFYEPEDIYGLLDSKFHELCKNSMSFSKIRVEGEQLARSYYGNSRGVEDVTLDEIYDYLYLHYGIERFLLDQMESYEKELEIRFCVPREAGRELFELSRAIGKKIVLISDMYLDRVTIEKILHKCGIDGYERLFLSCEERCLKYNGYLYLCALNALGIGKEEVLHIGDSWRSDIEGSDRAGIRNIFFPKATEVFENKICGCRTNRCADIGKTVSEGWISYQKIRKNLGFRCMQAVAANWYFDNPYRTFQPDSDFNVDPYFIGYYLLGMHGLGIAKWIEKNVKARNCQEIVFLARDGYIPMKIFRNYQNAVGSNIRINYLQASRKALMPWIVKNRMNFYQLPVEYRAHTPETLLDILKFADCGMESSEWMTLLEQNGLNPGTPFESKEKYHSFIKLFLENRYDEEKHERAKRIISRYYERINPGAIAFDMGYSGRIQTAVCEALDHPVDVLFIHEDYMVSSKMKQYSGFEIMDFYEFSPCITGLMREHIFSDVKGSCIGFEESANGIEPVFEENRHRYPDVCVVDAIQTGAMDYTENFLRIFGEFLDDMSFSSQEVSLPFEGFLRYPAPEDMHIFSASYFEDMVWGAEKEINIESFAMQNLKELGWSPGEICMEEPPVEISDLTEEKRIMDMIDHSSQFKRGLIWLLLDWKYFKEKFRININRIRKK